MNKKSIIKYTAMTTVSALTLAGCGQLDNGMEEAIFSSTSSNETDETLVVPDDMTTEEYAEGYLEEELTDIEDSEYYEQCDRWDEDTDGSVQCLDEDSPYYSQHFFNGLMFATLGAMAGNAMYKSMNKRDGEVRQKVINNSVVPPTNKTVPSTLKKEEKENTTPVGGGGAGSSSSSNKKGITNSNSNNESNSTSKSSSSNSNTNSYSSGKQGFSSGGAARGGSASS